MKVTRYTGGPLPTNCYMLTDESTGASAVIDPGFVNASLLKAVEEAEQKMEMEALINRALEQVEKVTVRYEQ